MRRTYVRFWRILNLPPSPKSQQLETLEITASSRPPRGPEPSKSLEPWACLFPSTLCFSRQVSPEGLMTIVCLHRDCTFGKLMSMECSWGSQPHSQPFWWSWLWFAPVLSGRELYLCSVKWRNCVQCDCLQPPAKEMSFGKIDTWPLVASPWRRELWSRGGGSSRPAHTETFESKLDNSKRSMAPSASRPFTALRLLH